MRKVIHIYIPEPCHEDWNKMSSAEKGRHCKVCNKTVIDFTKTTDEQLVKTFEEKGNLCGRFKSTQLNREIVLARKDKNNYLSFVASSLFAFLTIVTQHANAQKTPITTQIDTTAYNSIKGKIATSILNQKVISGNITSKNENLPLPGVNVIIKGTLNGTQTDFDGNFTLKVETDAILVISYVGMKTKEVKISHQKTYTLKLTLEEELQGEIVIVAGYSNYTTSEYIYSPEELERNKKRKENYFKFYQKKLKAHKTVQKQKRLQKRDQNVKRTLLGKFFYNITNIFRKRY